MMNNTVIKEGIIVAGDNIAAGDVILQVPMFLSGPGREQKPVCLGCLKPVRFLNF